MPRCLSFKPALPSIRPDCSRLSTTLQSYLSAASQYMRSSLAKSTLKVYDSAWIRFNSFCAFFSIPVLPVNISIVCAYIMHCLLAQKMQPSSIKSQVSGIQFHLRCLDPSVCSLLGHPSIRLLLDGIKKEAPKGKDKRLPLTLSLVKKLVTKLRQGCFSPYVDSLLEAVFLCAFYGFLRVGEFTTRNNIFDASYDLTVSDITLDEHYFSIFLKHSKSDKESKGIPVIIARTNTDFCPFHSMSRYLGFRPHARPDEPLFITEERKAMSRSWFAARLRLACQSCGLSPELYTSHSFRIGAATTAASVTTIHTLKTLGRWSSAAYERYVRPGIKDILDAQKVMDSM